MDNQPVIKAAIQSAVSKGIRDIRRDPNRSIRKLVDLGMQFGKGHNQKSFFTDAQSVLKDQRSVYYTLVTSLIRNVDEETLKTLGLNVGYMSWTMGAKMIRAFEKEHSVNVPWTILLRMNRPTEKPLDLAQLVQQGQMLGIYTYFLFVGKNTADLGRILHIAEQYSSSAFFLLAEDESMNMRMAASDAMLRNTLFVPRGGETGLSDISGILAQKKRMFSLNCEYNASNADYLVSEPFLQTVVAQGYPFLFFIPAPDCDENTRAYVLSQVLSVRAIARYPLFPIDLYTDVQQVDHIISDERCMLELDADGSVLYPAAVGTLSVADQSLEALIRQAMPRIRHHR